jgi:recombination protein RecA
MFGSPVTTPGGNALKFYASIRMEIRRTEQIKTSSGDPIGARARVTVTKNKLAPPFKKAEFDIMFDEGISRTGSIIDVALEMNILEKRGSWVSFAGEQLGQGTEQVKQALKESADLEGKLLAAIREKSGIGVRMGGAGSTSIPDDDDADVVESEDADS